MEEWCRRRRRRGTDQNRGIRDQTRMREGLALALALARALVEVGMGLVLAWTRGDWTAREESQRTVRLPSFSLE